MGLYYQTEYRLGPRRGTVRRSYTGLPAILAIAIDLVFLMTFELTVGVIVFLLKNVSWLRVGALHLLSWPFRAARWIAEKLDQKVAAARSRRDASAVLKPAWAGGDEL
jgi:hypothetical protein